jgi:MFS family permease
LFALRLTNDSIFGRIIPPFIADKLGRYNTNIVMAFLGSILTLALWLPSTGNAPIIVFALLYGVTSGAFVALIPALVAQISNLAEIGHRTGLAFAILSIPALVSNPIGGAILAQDNGKFRDMQIYSGVMLLAGSCLFVVSRIPLAGLKVFTKV